jgi:hypothetical protein
MKRKGLPSMRTMPVMGWGVPVQWVVSESVRLSVVDQTLKYGSCVMSGVAGGRCCAERGRTLSRDETATSRNGSEFFMTNLRERRRYLRIAPSFP